MNGLLVLNAGSSSIKFAIFGIVNGKPESQATGLIESIGSTKPHIKVKNAAGKVVDDIYPATTETYTHHHGLANLFELLKQHPEFPEVSAVGHRVVHGGTEFSKPMLLDDQKIEVIRALTPLAPLHQPHNLAGIDAVRQLFPSLPQVACFDTAFHTSRSELASMYAIPRKYREEGIRSYGFHGLSYEFIASHMGQVIGADLAQKKVVIAHLGNGASLCAVENGKSVSTTMGFTAIDGLTMGTRSGAIDPGVILHLMNHYGMGYKELSDFLYKECGLLGISGLTNDMRPLEEPDAAPDSKLAVEHFIYRLIREIGSAAAGMGGLDAIVFTGGIGEHSPIVRGAVCRAMAWLGIELDEAANEKNAPLIVKPSSRVKVAVIPTDEEGVIAGHILALVK